MYSVVSKGGGKTNDFFSGVSTQAEMFRKIIICIKYILLDDISNSFMTVTINMTVSIS